MVQDMSHKFRPKALNYLQETKFLQETDLKKLSSQITKNLETPVMGKCNLGNYLFREGVPLTSFIFTCFIIWKLGITGFQPFMFNPENMKKKTSTFSCKNFCKLMEIQISDQRGKFTVYK